MKTLIISIIITIILIHSIYYFKLDIFNMLKPMKNKNKNNENKNENITNHLQILNQSINELKTLNECIHNGKIDSTFS
jgi:hypothetical protein